jgi:Xaa-Pro aminopeptidase
MAAPSRFLAERHRRVRAALDAPAADALLVTHPPNVRYLTNHAGSAGVVLLTRDALHLFVDFRYAESVQQLQSSPQACPGLVVRDVPDSYDEALAAAIADLQLSTIALESAYVSVARFEWLRRKLQAAAPSAALSPADSPVDDARLVKDAWELGALREAASRLQPVLDRAIDAVRPGAAEREVAAVIEAALRQEGYERVAFDTIVASGPNSALPHYRAGDRRIARGDLVVLDFGGVLDGYCCDLTRTVAVGAPGPDALRVYEAVRDAQAAAIAAVRPGIAATAVDRAARAVLEARGLGPNFGHGTGHGLGLEVHEAPRVSRPRPDLDAVTLAPGMVFTIEPGAYLPGWGGVRIEDDVAVSGDGADVLTTAARELVVR